MTAVRADPPPADGSIPYRRGLSAATSAFISGPAVHGPTSPFDGSPMHP